MFIIALGNILYLESTCAPVVKNCIGKSQTAAQDCFIVQSYSGVLRAVKIDRYVLIICYFTAVANLMPYDTLAFLSAGEAALYKERNRAFISLYGYGLFEDGFIKKNYDILTPCIYGKVFAETFYSTAAAYSIGSIVFVD